jgi:hypothetical protein
VGQWVSGSVGQAHAFCVAVRLGVAAGTVLGSACADGVFGQV